VAAYLESNSPIMAYTATRIVKSFPGGIRQDSSNMDPMESVIKIFLGNFFALFFMKRKFEEKSKFIISNP